MKFFILGIASILFLSCSQESTSPEVSATAIADDHPSIIKAGPPLLQSVALIFAGNGSGFQSQLFPGQLFHVQFPSPSPEENSEPQFSISVYGADGRNLHQVEIVEAATHEKLHSQDCQTASRETGKCLLTVPDFYRQSECTLGNVSSNHLKPRPGHFLIRASYMDGSLKETALRFPAVCASSPVESQSADKRLPSSVLDESSHFLGLLVAFGFLLVLILMSLLFLRKPKSAQP